MTSGVSHSFAGSVTTGSNVANGGLPVIFGNQNPCNQNTSMNQLSNANFTNKQYEKLI